MVIYCHLSTDQYRSTMKTNTEVQGQNDFQKEKTHNLNRGLGP